MNLQQKAKFDVGLELKELDLCIPECLLTRADTNVPMIPCGLCDGWFHIQCLGLPEGGGPRCIRGLYFCQDCLQDLKALRQLAKPRREKEARFEAMESLVAALDVEQALLKELLSRSSINLDDVVVRVGGRVVDATYAELLRERAGLKRELVDVLAKTKASPQDDRVEKRAERNAKFNLLSKLQNEVQSRVAIIQPSAPSVQVQEEASIPKTKDKKDDKQNIPSTSDSNGSLKPGTANGELVVQTTQNWSKDRNYNECQICDKHFVRFDKLRAHHRDVHRLLLVQICECGQKFKHGARGLRSHQLKEHGTLVGHVNVLVPLAEDGDPPVISQTGEDEARARTRTPVKKSSRQIRPVAFKTLPGLASTASPTSGRVDAGRGSLDRTRTPGKKRARLTSPVAPKALASTASLASERSIRKQIYKGADGTSVCPICSKLFKRFDHLKIHLTSKHHHVVEFLCHACHKYFPRYYGLVSHQTDHHGGVAAKSVTCRPIENPQVSPVHPQEEEPSEEATTKSGSISSPSRAGSSRRTVVRSRVQKKLPPVVKITAKLSEVSPKGLLVQANRTSSFACHKCENSFSSSRNLRNHLLRRHQLEVLYSCTFCQSRFSQITELRSHQGEVHAGSIGYRKLFRRSSDEDKATGYKPVECHVCGVRYRETSVLKVHLQRVHQLETIYSCNSCDRRYSYLSDLRRHQHASKHKSYTKVYEPGVSTGELDGVSTLKLAAMQKSPAGVCEPGLSDSGGGGNAALKTVVIQRGPRSAVYDCHVCGSQMKRLDHLKLHLLRRHKTKILYSCDACGKQAPTLKSMHTHQIAMHGATGGYHLSCVPATDREQQLGVKPHQCHVCQMRFEMKTSIKNHMRQRHQIEYVSTCATCGQQFASLNLLNAHVRGKICRSSGDRVSSEVAAVLQAPARSRLASMRKKKGKSFAFSRVRCTLCRRQFASKGYLLRHLRVAHPEQYEAKISPFACQYCGCKFENRRSMDCHVSRTHPSRGQSASLAPTNEIGDQQPQMAFQEFQLDLSSDTNEITNEETNQVDVVKLEELEPAVMTFDHSEGQGEWIEPTSNEGCSHSNALLQVPEEQLVQIKVEPEEWGPIYILNTEIDSTSLTN